MASSRGILNIQSLNELTSENPILRMQNRHDFVCVDRGSIAAHGERPRRHKHSVPNEFTSKNGWLYK
jgi:thiamine pyrophosphokinase